MEGGFQSVATKDRFSTSYVLSAIVAVLMAVVSTEGAFFSQMYRDNPLIASTFHWQDYVTLFVALPLLIAGLLLEMRGSLRGRLVWVSMLGYAVYAYAFYCFAAAFNEFFLLYVAIFSASLFALLLSVPRMDVEAMGRRFGGAAAKWVAIVYMTLTAVGLGSLWIAMSLGFVFSGKVPGPIVTSGHPTSIVFALDLSIIVPAMIVASWLLISDRAWGWFLATILSLWGAVYTLSLAVASFGTKLDKVGSGSELPIWGVLTALGALAAVLLLRSVSPEK